MIMFLRKISITFSVFCLFVNVSILLFGVISRYIIGSSPIWIDELARYLLVSSVMLMIGVLALDNNHMRLNLIDGIKNKKVHLIVEVYKHIIIILISLGFVYVSYEYAISIFKFKTIGLGISKTIPLMLLPCGFFFVFLFSVVNLMKLFFYRE